MVLNGHKSDGLDDTKPTSHTSHPMNPNIETTPATLAEVADALGFTLEIIAGPAAAVEPATLREAAANH